MKYTIFFILLVICTPLGFTQIECLNKDNNSTKNIWTFTDIKKNPNGYELYWTNQKEKKENTILFRCSEKYFLFEKLLKKIPKDKLKKEFKAKGEFFPYGAFFEFLAKESGIKIKDIYSKNFNGMFHEIYYERIFFNLDEKKYPIKLEFEKYIKNERPPNYKTKDIRQLMRYINDKEDILFSYTRYHSDGSSHRFMSQRPYDENLNIKVLSFFKQKRKLYIEYCDQYGFEKFLHPE